MTDDPRPFCECGNCNSTGKPDGPGGIPTKREVRLPMEAWAVAGAGDYHRLAVARGHEEPFRDGNHTIEDHGTWLAIGGALE